MEERRVKNSFVPRENDPGCYRPMTPEELEARDARINLEDIKERFNRAQYAVACAQGKGSFGVTEQRMLQEFQEHAVEDVGALLKRIQELEEQ